MDETAQDAIQELTAAGLERGDIDLLNRTSAATGSEAQEAVGAKNPIFSRNWLGLTVMPHRNHNISLLVPLLNILESFRDLLQWITSVDNRLERSMRGELYNEIHSFQVLHGHTTL